MDKQFTEGSQFPGVQSGLKIGIAGSVTIYNVAFPYDISAALAMPVTEMAIVTATTPEAKKVSKGIIEVLSVVTEHLGSHSLVIDNGGIFVWIRGWDLSRLAFDIEYQTLASLMLSLL